MIGSESRERLQTIPAGAGPPSGAFVEHRIGFRQEQSRRATPKSKFVMKRNGVVGSMRYEQRGPLEILLQCRHNGEAGGARQSEGTRVAACLQLLQETLIPRQRADSAEKQIHG